MSNTLLITGLSPQVNFVELRSVFEKFGPCFMEVRGDQALVEFQNEKSSSQALYYLNNTNLQGINPNNVAINYVYPTENSSQNSRVLAPLSINTLGGANQFYDGKTSPSFGGMNNAKVTRVYYFFDQ